MTQQTITRTAALAALLSLSAVAHAQTDLERGFQNPPASAKPHTWWHWMNGNVSKEGITADLEAMAKAGIGGAQIFNVDQGIPKGKLPFMSPGWMDAIVHAAKEAKRLHLELCLHNCAGWSSSGGPWIDPAHSMQVLTWSETNISGGQTINATLPEPAKKANYYQDICVLAVKRAPQEGTARLADIRTKAFFERGGNGLGTNTSSPQGGNGTTGIPTSDSIVLSCKPDGTFTWNAPAGDWTLIRMGHTTTGAVNAPAPDAGRGLECDKLSREAVDLHWHQGVEPILKAMGPDLAGKVLNNALIDSYEVGAQNWTPALQAEFRARTGYDMLPYLPVITGRIVGSSEESERFLWDLRRTIADLFAKNYAERFRDWCHQYGMKFSVEPYGNGTFDNLQIGALADIPMGEFWIGGAASETIKIAASSAHVTGKSIVGAESFTADESRGRWLVEPYGIKALGDRMFAEGLNRYIFHRYAHQPWIGLNPGMTMGPWGTHLERTVTWWDQSREWLRYIARCQYLLQSGTFVADVLTFEGDDAPNDLYRPTLPAGFDYDGCDRTVLLSAHVENKQIVLPGGARYRVLLLPPSDRMLPETALKIAELVKAGATVVGRIPTKSPSLSDYPRGDVSVQRVLTQVKLTPPDQLEGIFGTPDVTLSDPRGRAAYPWIHRRAGNTDFYFVSNSRYTNQQVTAHFRVTGKAPELWHPETGTLEAAPVWHSVGDGTEVTLNLGPAESVFVVFRKPATDNHLVQITRTGDTARPGAHLPVLAIESATYEATDGAGHADVTAKVRALVEQGTTDIPATNELFGDAALNHVKRLRIVYTVDGQRQEKTAGENDTLSLIGNTLDTRLPDYQVKNGNLIAFSRGTYTLTPAQGQPRQIVAPSFTELPLNAPWTLTFPPHLGAPASVTLNQLISWADHPTPGVKYFSGTATYTTTFTATTNQLDRTRAHFLDLGQVKNFAQVTLNGKTLPTLWKAPWRVDVSNLLRPGTNTLQIQVTNLWPNRLIGDEQLPPEVEWSGPTGPIKQWPQWLLDGKPRPQTDRVTFTTWRFWTKNDTPLPSGLLGPVLLRSLPVIPVTLR